MHLISEKDAWQIPAVIAAFLNIYLAARASIWNWFFGIIAVTLYAVIFYHAKLYGDMSLQGFYFVLQFYGYYQWKFGGAKHTELSVLHLPKKQYWIYGFAFLILFGLFYYLLSHHTNSTTPIIDAFTTALSLVAQWMMCKKYLENWVLWMIMDAISIYMYSYKQLYLTGVLYAAFFVLCVMGFRTWKAVVVSMRESIY